MHSIPKGAQLTCQAGDPGTCYARWCRLREPGEALLLVNFEFSAYWLDNPTPQPLTAIYYVAGEKLQLAVTEQRLVAECLPPRQQFSRWVARHRLLIFDPACPLQLLPLHIDKPWGREIWYTGVERRGVSEFASGDARTPIPWLQAAAPSGAVGVPGEPLVLLKILDPSPQPEQGDLYFELHQRKHEVYVVTHIDDRAWPDGIGYIRFGFDQALLASYPSEDQFRADYLAAVQAYEIQRRALDEMTALGIAPALEQLGREQLLRERMNRFTHLRPVRVGEVIRVPLLLPHGLQHGVRTIEFQTPTYERKILSFGQKVLTQEHWDTREAVAHMQLIPEALSSPAPVRSSGGAAIEQIVDFPDFEVLRATVQPGACWQVECDASYAVVMVVTGELDLAGTGYRPEQALLLPRFWRGNLAASETVHPLVILLARPRS